jgi:hypothetical protein
MIWPVWPEGLALGLFILAFVFFLLRTGSDFTIQGGILFSGLIAIIVWIVFRTINFIFGGPARRRSRAP